MDISFWFAIAGLACAAINCIAWRINDKTANLYVQRSRTVELAIRFLVGLSILSTVLSLIYILPLGTSSIFIGIFLVVFNIHSAYYHFANGRPNVRA